MKRHRRFAVALHEATHAVVAKEVGLPVEWASIDPGYDHEERMFYPAAVKITDEENQDRELVSVAMAAPSFIDTGDRSMNRYGKSEAIRAYSLAAQHGVDPKAVHDRAEHLVTEKRNEILNLAKRLMAEGMVKAA